MQNKLHCIPLPTPFPIGPVNVYLAEGEPLTLIDAGPNTEAARVALDDGLRARGYAVTDLQQIIITHHHVDHMGLTAELAARSGAQVRTHAFNLPWLADYAGTRERHAPFYRQLFRGGGVPPAVAREIETDSAALAQWAAPFAHAHTLREGDAVPFAEATWQVYHTPGHAGGLVCLWEPHSRTLLANDHLLRDVSSNAIIEPPEAAHAARPRRLRDYVRELQRMAQLRPLQVLPGHGESFSHVASLVAERWSFHQHRARIIYALLEHEPLPLWQVMRALFPDLRSGVECFLGLSEVLGHLDLLVEEQQVCEVTAGELVLWQRSH